MDSNGTRWDADGDRQSPRSTKKDSQESLRCQEEESNDDETEKNITWHSDSEQDQQSTVDGRRGSASSFYSEEYKSPSEGTKSPDSQSRIPCHSPRRQMQGKTTSSTRVNKKVYAGRPAAYRQEHPSWQILSQQHRRNTRWQTKEQAPCKDLDMAAKRLLSSRLLKINELKNTNTELQKQFDQILVENRTLRQVQARLQHHNDTESQVAKLMSHHSKETQAYREQLRRCHEKIRALEHKLKDKEEQLQKEQAQLKKSRATILRLRQLLARNDLETRDELSQKLEKEKLRAQVAEEKVKEVEHLKDLSINLYQRQVATEKRKTINVLEDNQSLQQTLEELTQKLRKKERELDTMNIYANRMLRRDADTGRKQKVTSRSSTKAAEPTQGTSTPDFPTPPPAVCEQVPEEYLSLKNNGGKPTKAEDRSQKEEQQRVEDRDKHKTLVEKEPEKEEKRQIFQEPKKPATPAQRPERGETQRDGAASVLKQEEELQVRHSRVQELATDQLQEAPASQDPVQARRIKDQVLSKMHEIDKENHSSQCPAFGTEALPTLAADAGGTEGRRPAVEGAARGAGRRALQSPGPGNGLRFGSYMPSFINPTPQRSLNFPASPVTEKRDGAFETGGLLTSRGVEAERGKVEENKAKPPKFLQHMLPTKMAAEGKNMFDSLDALDPPPATNVPRSTRERPFNFNPPQSTISTIQATRTRPTVRAFPSFDADIEELTL